MIDREYARKLLLDIEESMRILEDASKPFESPFAR